MNTVFINICFGYLIGLALLGYVGILAQIKILDEGNAWPKWFSNFLVALHFVIGLSSVIYLPITMFNKISSSSHEFGNFAFAITLIVMIFVVIMIVAFWNRKLNQKDKSRGSEG